MTEKLQNQISAFIDGELPDAEQELLIRRLARDTECRATLRRYALIGSVMRSFSVNLAVADLSQGVAVAIESEPSHDGTGTAEDRLFRVLKPIAGIAVAASVALLAIVSLQAPDVDGIGESPPVVQAGMGGNVSAVPVNYVPDNNSDRLTNYLIQHSEYSPMGSRNVLLEIIGNDEVVAEKAEQATNGDEKAEE